MLIHLYRQRSILVVRPAEWRLLIPDLTIIRTLVMKEYEAQAKQAHACWQAGRSGDGYATLSKLATSGDKDFARAYARVITTEIDKSSHLYETVQGMRRNDDNSWDYWVDAKKRIAHIRVATLAQHNFGEYQRVDQ